MTAWLRLTLLGTGAINSPRYPPAGHIGRPSLRAIDAGYQLPFGEWGVPGRTYRIPVLPAQAPPSRSRS